MSGRERCRPMGNDEGREPWAPAARVPSMCPPVGHVQGDRLWVRETFASDVPGCEEQGGYSYRADHIDPMGDGPANPMKWTPPIFMRRSASRILLEVVSARIERLNAITEEDAQREGLSRLSKDGGRVWKYGIPDRDGLPGNDDDGWHWKEWSASARAAFFTLWDKINGDRARSSIDPWVWRVEFRRVA